MSIFQTKSQAEKDQKTVDKTRALLLKYGLDFDNYTEQDLHNQNIHNLMTIARDNVGNKWFKAGLALSFAKAEEQAKVTYLSTLVEQNWIIIRQNEAIVRKLDKLN